MLSVVDAGIRVGSCGCIVVVVVGVVVGDDGASHCVNNVVTIGSDIGVVIVGEVVDSVALVRM